MTRSALKYPRRAFVCQCCRIEFLSANQTAKFCSLACVTLHKRSHRATECEECGVLFTPIRRSNVGAALPFKAVGDVATCCDECLSALNSRKVSLLTGARKGTWKGGVSGVLGSFRGVNWPSISRKVRLRDGMRCADCGLSNERHRDTYKRSLEVHHIRPFHTFTDHRAANDMRNLRTLCRPCHAAADAILPKQIILDLGHRPVRRIGGLARGTRHGQHVLTEEFVIRSRAENRGGKSVYAIAKESGFPYMTVMSAVRRQSWSHLP